MVGDRRGHTAPAYKHLVLLICLIVISIEEEKNTSWANILQKPPPLKLKYTDFPTYNLKIPVPVENTFQK
jgi:hypothetical protein